MFFDTMLSAMPFVKDGRLKALAVTGAKRSPARPELPTMAEAGVAGYEFMTWNGFFAPVRTPGAVVTQLNREIARVLALPEVQKRIVGDGAEIASGTPQDFAAYVKVEREKLERVIQSAGIRID
jgi:tripartite-type tricarboxylate transporter receptor subunit TctC